MWRELIRSYSRKKLSLPQEARVPVQLVFAAQLLYTSKQGQKMQKGLPAAE